MSIYECPHCHEKTFNPVTKALTGRMNTKGRKCKNCGKSCCNGMASTIFHSATSVAALIISVICYIGDFGIELTISGTYMKGSYLVIIICILSSFVLNKLFDAFFGHLTKSARTDAY